MNKYEISDAQSAFFVAFLLTVLVVSIIISRCEPAAEPVPPIEPVEPAETISPATLKDTTRTGATGADDGPEPVNQNQ